MDTTKYTFWTLIENYNIKIPIIQRDYAQGRNTEKASEIRFRFLQSLYDSLFNSSKIDLDFIYGSVKDTDLTPLDGQQRLTTLFLLHWYLAIKDDKLAEVKKILLKFSYETRISASEFCRELVDKGITYEVGDAKTRLSNRIMDSSWFYLSWIKDPTVKSMLNMLDAVDEKFRNSAITFDHLIKKDDSLISFQFIAIDTFGLTDNLYIKMNARGKALTEFENLKAKFEQHLEKNNPLKKIEFVEKIDTVWTDFFWNHREDHLIDNPFMRYLGFITEMLYYIECVENPPISINYNPKLTFELMADVYIDDTNIEFLFKSLDLLHKINNTESFFDSIFSKFDYKVGKVTLFDNNTDLFKSCIRNENFGIKEKIYFFTIISNLIQTGSNEANNDLVDLIRVVRNLLLRDRQQNNTQINSNLRIANVPEQIYSITSNFTAAVNIYDLLSKSSDIDLKGFTKESLNYEKEKATIIKTEAKLKPVFFELEDNRLFTGSIHNLDLNKNKQNLYTYVQSINEVWSCNDSLITRALLTIADYSILTGGSKLGEKWFFGNEDNWLTVLTHTTTDKVRNMFSVFLDAYNDVAGKLPEDKLNKMIDAWLSLNSSRTWQYYFIKYPEITNSTNNNYAWLNDFELRQLIGSTLLSAHINPYVKTVISIINDSDICELNRAYGQNRENSPLVLCNNVMLYCQETDWKVVLPDGIDLTPATKKKFDLESDLNGDYFLVETIDLNRIEIAVEFCRTLKTLTL